MVVPDPVFGSARLCQVLVPRFLFGAGVSWLGQRCEALPGRAGPCRGWGAARHMCRAKSSEVLKTWALRCLHCCPVGWCVLGPRRMTFFDPQRYHPDNRWGDTFEGENAD